MASQNNDPRLPSAARPYKPPIISQQDLPVDYSGFIAVVFGVFGAMFRYKVCSWLAIIFCAQSLANMRNMENDLKQISMAMIWIPFSIANAFILATSLLMRAQSLLKPS
ncbi:asterix-like protein [Perilla frutescens var. hirtella]|nr:asterix-like protein [Perilla frutescens var. hirtella]